MNQSPLTRLLLNIIHNYVCSFLFTVYHCLASDFDANLPKSLTFFRLNCKAYSNCTSSLYFSPSCQKSHPLQQANYLKSLHLHAKTFTKVRRLANQQRNACGTVKPEFEANCATFFLPYFSSLRSTCSHPRIQGSGSPVQVIRAGSVNRSRDGICSALHQTHFRKSHDLPVRLHQHAERPAAAAGYGPDGAVRGLRGSTLRTCT